MSLFSLKTSRSPLFNDPTQFIVGHGIVTRPSEYDDLDWYVQRVPELARVVAAVQEDILGGGVFFEGPESGVKRAEAFWNDNFVQEELKKALFDWLLYGDGYLWLGKLSAPELEQVRLKSLARLPVGFRHHEFKVRDEDEINFVRHVPSTTMNIDLTDDKTRIKHFRQVIAADEVRTWPVNEIVHGKYWTLKGQVYGFSPARASLAHIQTIGYIIDYAKSWFRNGGTPDWLFMFEDEPPTSPRIKDLREQFQTFLNPMEKHGNRFGTGKMNPVQLNNFGKDMEFRQLLIQMTGILAFGYGLPAGRISSIIGAEVKVSTGSDDLANEAYGGMLKGHQDYWETLLNSQIFSRFGKVKLHFPDTRKVNEVREAQAKLQVTDYLTSLRSLGVDYNMQYVKDMLGLKNEHLKSQVLKPMQPDSGFRQNAMPNKQLEMGVARQGNANQKRKEQNTSVSDKQNIGA